MLLRNTDQIPATVPGVLPGGVQPDLVPYVMRAFETIAMARVSTSAREAQKIGYLTPQDRITLNQDYLIHDARDTLSHSQRRLQASQAAGRYQGYRPHRHATLEAAVYNMKEGAFISEHDALIAGKIATVLTGGDLPQNSVVTEEYLLTGKRGLPFAVRRAEVSGPDGRHAADRQTSQELALAVRIERT